MTTDLYDPLTYNNLNASSPALQRRINEHAKSIRQAESGRFLFDARRRPSTKKNVDPPGV